MKNWDEIRAAILSTGALEAAVARCETVDDRDSAEMEKWLSRGCNASMKYLARNEEIRRDPSQLLPGCCSVVSIAFPCNPPRLRPAGLPYIARFAYGRDYHKTIRTLLRPVCREMEAATGCRTRICVDSAPLRERYWAFRSGLAVRGRNGLAIIPGHGSLFMLAEILTTLELPAAPPASGAGEGCLGCNRCVEACPGKALLGDGTVDARRCLSYLTIEAPEGERPQGDGNLFGCDVCQLVCPHNEGAGPSPIAAFAGTPEILSLSREDLLAMTPEEFDTRFAGTSLRRAGLAKLRSNLHH